MSSKNFYGLTGDVTVDGGILNVGNAQLYANTETSNVGIGTPNPEFELDVRGDANVHNLYATYLHGDGSNIENIVSSQWEGSPGDPIYYTSNVGIANTAPVTKTLQVGSNLYVEDAGSNVIHVTGNIYADYLVGDGSQLTGIAASLDQIVDQGNTVSNTIQIVSGQDATSNIGLVTHEGVSISVSNANPTGEYQFGVGSNLLVNVYSSNVLTVDGNVFAQKMTLGTVTVTPAYNLQQITTKGATTSQTLILENATTGLTTTSNVGIANTAPVHTLDVGSNLYVEDTGSNVLTVTGNVSVSGDLNVGSNLSVEDTGSNVLSVTGNVSVSNRLDVGSNLHIENLRVAEVASNLVTYDSTTGEIMDSGGLFSNKLAVVSEQPPIALTGASTVVTNHGTYTIEASSGTVVNLFDKNDSTKWVTDGNYSTNVDTKGTYNGSASLAGHGGEWVKITMPYKTILRHIKIESTNESVEDIELVGLNADGLTWTPLKTETGLTGPTHTIIVNATTHHRTYGLIVEKTNTTTGRSAVEIGDLKLFTESFSIDGGKVEMATSAVMGGETTMDQHGPHGRDGAAKLKKYPEIVFEEGKFDRNDTTNTYTQAGYTVTASSQANDVKNAATLYDGKFPDIDTSKTAWQGKINTYDSNGDATSIDTLTGITGGVGSRNGSYTTLELPHKIKVSRLQLHTRNLTNHSSPGHPGQVYVYGSNDGSSWTQIGSHLFTSTPSGPIWQTIDINSTTLYNYFALQATSILGTTGRLSLIDLEWYGYEELATQGDTSVDTTFTSIMNTPQTTGANVYVDGNLGETLTNRVTGPDATGTSATYDETGKYWELNGELTSNIAVEANTFLEGDAPHSVSVWFNSSNLEANVSNTCVFSISDQEKLDSMNLDLQSNTWHNLTYAYQGEGGSRVTYLDGRKVAEDQAEDTFGDYPPFAMTGYSQGGYTVSASSELSGDYYAAWEAFNRVDTADESYISADGMYTGNGGLYNANGGTLKNLGTLTGGFSTTINGEYVIIEMPHKLKLSYVNVKERINQTTRAPGDGKIYGSNDGFNWIEVASFSGLTYTDTDNVFTAITANATTAYQKFALVVSKISGSMSYLAIGQLRFYGHRENDLVRLPDPTNVLKYPHIILYDNGSNVSEYAKRGYVVKASSHLAEYPPYHAFDGVYEWVVNQSAWISDGGYSSGVPTMTTTDPKCTTIDGVQTPGEWIELQTPHKIKVSYIKVTPQGENTSTLDRAPKAATLAGSIDGTTWETLLTWANVSDWAIESGTTGLTKTFSVTNNTNKSYNYFRLVSTETDGIDAYTSIQEFELYGTGVDSIPIQIGGGNIDKVANFRVYDKFVGEDQALEIWDAQKDAFGRAKSSMTLQKGRLGIGTTEPEGRLAVLDEPHNLEEFPPRAMTGYETYMEGHGVFKASASVDFGSNNYRSWNAFDKLNTSWNGGWATPTFTWDASGSLLPDTSNVVTFDGVQCHWLALELPYVVKPDHVTLLARVDPGVPTEVPGKGRIYGSKDGVTWDQIRTYNIRDEVSTLNTSMGNTPISIPLTTINYYKHLLLTVEERYGGSVGTPTWTSIGQLKYFGTREQGQSVLHDGQLTLTKNLNVPRIGPPIDADDTPRRDRLVVEYNTSTNPTFEGAVRDTSGRGFHGALFGGAYYDATEKALRFDGSGDYTEVQLPSHQVKGEWIHSVSCWVKADVINGEEAVWNIGDRTGQASGIVGSASTLAFNNLSPTLRWYFYNADAHTSNFTVATGQWYHITCVYTGGVSSATSQTIYVNGVEYVFNIFAGAGGALNFDANRDRILMLGRLPWSGSSDFDGSISNFKLYDTALTAEEVKTLYDMGRTGHIVNPQPLHIAAPVQVEKTLRIPIDNTDTGTYTAGMIRYNPDLDKIQVYNGTVWLTIGGVTATGGTITRSGGYTIHTFISAGTFTVTSGGDMEYLIVAGGGAGGYNHGGGGGGGGVLTGTLYGLENGSYTITRGAGGAFVSAGTGGNGSNSTALGLTAIGGGGGGRGYAPNGSAQAQVGANGSSGGSGGGGGPFHVGGAGTAGPPIQGYVGGNGINNGSQAGHGGGGGGAGGVGGNGLISGENNQGVSGKGGIGLVSLISGSSSQYAGGGSGGRWGGSLTTDVAGGVGSATGGGGIGGAKSSPEAYYATAGTSNTGGGGGGGGDGGANGANGGSGIVIIRYLS
jgi:hypothetical protein